MVPSPVSDPVGVIVTRFPAATFTACLACSLMTVFPASVILERSFRLVMSEVFAAILVLLALMAVVLSVIFVLLAAMFWVLVEILEALAEIAEVFLSMAVDVTPKS